MKVTTKQTHEACVEHDGVKLIYVKRDEEVRVYFVDNEGTSHVMFDVGGQKEQEVFEFFSEFVKTRRTQNDISYRKQSEIEQRGRGENS